MDVTPDPQSATSQRAESQRAPAGMTSGRDGRWRRRQVVVKPRDNRVVDGVSGGGEVGAQHLHPLPDGRRPVALEAPKDGPRNRLGPRAVELDVVQGASHLHEVRLGAGLDVVQLVQVDAHGGRGASRQLAPVARGVGRSVADGVSLLLRHHHDDGLLVRGDDNLPAVLVAVELDFLLNERLDVLGGVERPVCQRKPLEVVGQGHDAQVGDDDDVAAVARARCSGRPGSHRQTTRP